MFSGWFPQCPAIQWLSQAPECKGGSREASSCLSSNHRDQCRHLPQETTRDSFPAPTREQPSGLTLETPSSHDSSCTRGPHSSGIEARSGDSFSTEPPQLALIFIIVETLLPTKRKKTTTQKNPHEDQGRPSATSCPSPPGMGKVGIRPYLAIRANANDL